MRTRPATTRERRLAPAMALAAAPAPAQTTIKLDCECPAGARPPETQDSPQSETKWPTKRFSASYNPPNISGKYFRANFSDKTSGNAFRQLPVVDVIFSIHPVNYSVDSYAQSGDPIAMRDQHNADI